MKEFDAFENSIKESIKGFADTKPSKMLWLKINVSLLFAFLLRKTSLIIGIFIIITIASFGWIYSKNTSSLNTKTTINKFLAKATDNPNNNILNNTSSNRSVGALKTSNNSMVQKTPKGITTNMLAEETKEISKKHANNNINDNSSLKPDIIKVQNSSTIILDNTITNKNTKKSGTINSNTLAIKNIINDKTAKKTSYIVDTQNRSIREIDNNKLVNKRSLSKDEQQSNFLSDYKIFIMSLINTSNKYSNEDFLKNPKYKIIPSHNNKILSDYEVFMGPNLNYSIFKLNPNNISDNELNKSSILPSYHFGANYNFYYKNWFIRTGINYSNIKEQINYTTNSLDIDSHTFYYTIVSNTYNWDTTGWNTNMGGSIDSIPIVSLGVQQTNNQTSITEYDSTINSQKQQYKNSYSSINIPLLMGYKFNFDRFTFDIATGISWSHITKLETHILDPIIGEVVTVNKDNGNVKRDIFNGVFSFGVGYRINGLNTIFIRPELQYNFNSIFDKTNFNKYKVLQMKLSIGLRYSIK